MNRGKALLATARIANVPSVVSNLVTGALVGSVMAPRGFNWPWLLIVGAVLTYIGANFLNDLWDVEWDRKHRPERALPSGLFCRRTYFAVGMAGLMGIICAAVFHGAAALWSAGGLVGLIFFYLVIHKKTALSVIPMGLCRAMLPVIGFLSVAGGFESELLFPALGLFLYVAGLSLVAKYEARGEVPFWKKWIAVGVLLSAGLIPAWFSFTLNERLAWIGLAPFGIWLGICFMVARSSVARFVGALLAGIPLVDWVILLPLALAWKAASSTGNLDTAFWTALLLAPVCFVFGRLLQRVAPAS